MPQSPRLLTPTGKSKKEEGLVLVARAIAEVRAMSTDFKPGDIVRHKSGGQDIIIIRLEDESVVAGATKKLKVLWSVRRPEFSPGDNSGVDPGVRESAVQHLSALVAGYLRGFNRTSTALGGPFCDAPACKLKTVYAARRDVSI
jgi:hypothetical protein